MWAVGFLQVTWGRSRGQSRIYALTFIGGPIVVGIPTVIP